MNISDGNNCGRVRHENFKLNHENASAAQTRDSTVIPWGQYWAIWSRIVDPAFNLFAQTNTYCLQKQILKAAVFLEKDVMLHRCRWCEEIILTSVLNRPALSLQISNRVLYVFFTHVQEFFGNVTLKQVTKPLRWSNMATMPALPETQESIKEEIRRQVGNYFSVPVYYWMRQVQDKDKFL